MPPPFDISDDDMRRAAYQQALGAPQLTPDLSYAGGTTLGVNSYIGPGRARVTPPSMVDVQPIYGDEDMPHQAVLSNEEQNWLNIYNSLIRSNAPQSVIDYHMTQNPNAALGARIQAGKALVPQDANVIQQAMLARQRQLKR